MGRANPERRLSFREAKRVRPLADLAGSPAGGRPLGRWGVVPIVPRKWSEQTTIIPKCSRCRCRTFFLGIRLLALRIGELRRISVILAHMYCLCRSKAIFPLRASSKSVVGILHLRFSWPSQAQNRPLPEVLLLGPARYPAPQARSERSALV